MMPGNDSADVTPIRQAGRRRNRKDDVFEAAIGVFWRKGYSASSVQDVADAVGVLKGSLYYYIKSKEDVLAQIVEDVHVRSRAILDEVVALDVPPLERVRTYIERHVAWYLENVPEVTVYFRDWGFLTGERRDLAAARRRGYDRAVRRMITDAQAHGDVHPDVDPKYASFYVLSAVNHVPDWYRPGEGDPPGRIAAAYADLVVGTLVGTRPRNPAPPAVAKRRTERADAARKAGRVRASGR